MEEKSSYMELLEPGMIPIEIREQCVPNGHDIAPC